jgi:hypothetical protein
MDEIMGFKNLRKNTKPRAEPKRPEEVKVSLKANMPSRGVVAAGLLLFLLLLLFVAVLVLLLVLAVLVLGAAPRLGHSARKAQRSRASAVRCAAHTAASPQRTLLPPSYVQPTSVQSLIDQRRVNMGLDEDDDDDDDESSSWEADD